MKTSWRISEGGGVAHTVGAVTALLEREDYTRVAWYRCLYAPSRGRGVCQSPPEGGIRGPVLAARRARAHFGRRPRGPYLVLARVAPARRSRPATERVAADAGVKLVREEMPCLLHRPRRR